MLIWLDNYLDAGELKFSSAGGLKYRKKYRYKPIQQVLLTLKRLTVNKPINIYD